jgi:hypothetical protein
MFNGMSINLYCEYYGIRLPRVKRIIENQQTLQVWRNYGPAAQTLIGRMVVETPLTDVQLRRLPSRLREVVSA